MGTIRFDDTLEHPQESEVRFWNDKVSALLYPTDAMDHKLQTQNTYIGGVVWQKKEQYNLLPDDVTRRQKNTVEERRGQLHPDNGMHQPSSKPSIVAFCKAQAFYSLLMCQQSKKGCWNKYHIHS